MYISEHSVSQLEWTVPIHTLIPTKIAMVNR